MKRTPHKAYSNSDSHAFGMPMPGRNYNSTDYRFGFNGQEKVDEMYGSSGTYYEFTYRGYDARLGRFTSVDPLTSDYPYWTPYQFAGNMPIRYVDLEGLEPAEPGTEKGQMSTATINGSESKDNYRWDWSGESWENKGRMLDEVVVTADRNSPSTTSNAPANTPETKTPTTPATLKMPNPEFSSTTPNKTPWMNTALNEFNAGVKEVPKGSNSGPKVDVYLKYAGVSSPNAWCGAFVNWCLGQNDIKGAGAKGSNYLNWGTKLQTPTYGAIAIFTTNHVGFYMGAYPDGSLKILHGNWSDKVTISKPIYDPVLPSQIKEYRFPKN